MKTFREMREKVGLTQLELGLKLGYQNGQFVSNIERNIGQLPISKIRLMAKVFKVPMDCLIELKIKDTEQRIRKFLK